MELSFFSPFPIGKSIVTRPQNLSTHTTYELKDDGGTIGDAKGVAGINGVDSPPLSPAPKSSLFDNPSAWLVTPLRRFAAFSTRKKLGNRMDKTLYHTQSQKTMTPRGIESRIRRGIENGIHTNRASPINEFSIECHLVSNKRILQNPRLSCGKL
jgi:hypothetical protein